MLISRFICLTYSDVQAIRQSEGKSESFWFDLVFVVIVVVEYYTLHRILHMVVNNFDCGATSTNNSIGILVFEILRRWKQGSRTFLVKSESTWFILEEAQVVLRKQDTLSIQFMYHLETEKMH